MPDLSNAKRRSRLRRTALAFTTLLAALAVSDLPVLRPAIAAAPSTDAALALAGDLAEAATTRLSRRLERLRDPESVEASGVDLELRLGAVEADRTLDPWLAEVPLPALPLAFDASTFEGRPLPVRQLEVRRSARSTGAADLWSTGHVQFGRQGSGMLDALASTADVTAGVDGSLSNDRSAGVAVGFNRLTADGVGTLSAPSVSAYGGLRPTPHSFADILAGIALLEREGAAEAALGGGMMGFAAATFGYDHHSGALALSPYARLEASGLRTRLTDKGAIASARVMAGRASMAAGLKADYRLTRHGMTLKPGLGLEMLRDLARLGEGNGSVSQSTQRYVLSPGVRADLGSGWSARLEHRSVFGAVDTRALELRVDARF